MPWQSCGGCQQMWCLHLLCLSNAACSLLLLGLLATEWSSFSSAHLQLLSCS